MALEDIFRALEEEAEGEATRVRTEAQTEADRILAAAEEQAESYRIARIERAEAGLSSKTTRAVAAAGTQVRRQVASARDKQIDAVFTEARRRLLEVRESADYDRLLAALIAEGVENLEPPLVVRVAPQDVEVARRAVAAAASVEPAEDIDAGAVVTGSGGGLVRDNRLTDRLERVRELARARVAELLFS